MSKVSINLLPPELENVKKERARRALINQISIIILVAIIAVAGGVLALRFSQNATLSDLNSKVESATNTISSPLYRKKEALVTTVKTRVTNTTTALNKVYPSTDAYQLVKKLTPENVKVTNLVIENKGKMTITIETNTTADLDQFLNNLVDPEKNDKRITQTSVESVNRGKTDTMRVEVGAILENPSTKKIAEK